MLNHLKKAHKTLFDNPESGPMDNYVEKGDLLVSLGFCVMVLLFLSL